MNYPNLKQFQRLCSYTWMMIGYYPAQGGACGFDYECSSCQLKSRINVFPKPWQIYIPTVDV